MLRSVLLVSLLAAPAFATAQFPATIQNKYGLASPPPQSCGLCHTNGITGNGTVNTPIGRALRMRGLVANDEPSLIAALDTLATDMVDSDSDGITDVAELMAGTNPNVADAPTDGGTGGGAGGGGGRRQRGGAAPASLWLRRCGGAPAAVGGGALPAAAASLAHPARLRPC